MSSNKAPKINLSFAVRWIIAIVIVLWLAEAWPELINTFLALLLVGVVLSNFKQFQFLASWLGGLAG